MGSRYTCVAFMLKVLDMHPSARSVKYQFDYLAFLHSAFASEISTLLVFVSETSNSPVCAPYQKKFSREFFTFCAFVSETLALLIFVSETSTLIVFVTQTSTLVGISRWAHFFS